MKPTQEQVIAWAREAGLEQTISIAPDNSSRIVSCPPIEPLERLAALAYEAGRKDENEACANVLDDMTNDMAREMEPSTAIAYVRSKAAEIRSRGQQ